MIGIDITAGDAIVAVAVIDATVVIIVVLIAVVVIVVVVVDIMAFRLDHTQTHTHTLRNQESYQRLNQFKCAWSHKSASISFISPTLNRHRPLHPIESHIHTRTVAALLRPKDSVVVYRIYARMFCFYRFFFFLMHLKCPSYEKKTERTSE